MLAKRFFYVSTALFLLAMTYHLGATSATSQSQSVVAGTSGTFQAAILSGGALYTGNYSSGLWTAAGPFSLPKPGVVAAVGYGNGSGSVVYEDGDFYLQSQDPDSLSGVHWIRAGNLLGATPSVTRATTWGKVKADYRK